VKNLSTFISLTRAASRVIGAKFAQRDKLEELIHYPSAVRRGSFMKIILTPVAAEHADTGFHE
jgi:hypothetical protein